MYFDYHYEENIATGLKPVLIGEDLYFTQRYEHCKYEKIAYQIDDGERKEIFDEKKLITKELPSKTTRFSFVAPPKGSKNVKKLRLFVDKVKTDDCSLNDANLALTTKIPNDDKIYESHEGKVINTESLEENNIKVEVVKPDEEVIIYPSFDYKYDRSRP